MPQMLKPLSGYKFKCVEISKQCWLIFINKTPFLSQIGSYVIG
jgi:hypothetical protein